MLLTTRSRCASARTRTATTTTITATLQYVFLHTSAFLHSDDQRKGRPRSRSPQSGLSTPAPKSSSQNSSNSNSHSSSSSSNSPFYLASGYSGWAKRPSRPFPPPFFSPPSGSFSDPLSTHHRSVDRVDGQMIRGVTNGDDAILAEKNLILANDGVGAWATRERGCAGLWSRLIGHFLAVEVEEKSLGDGEGEGDGEPDLVGWCAGAYERTKEVLMREGEEWLGTTTVSAALLHYRGKGGTQQPVLYVIQLGDCRVMVVRATEKGENNEAKDPEVVFSTKEQWHYFDCPRQLGTNSPDTPEENGVVDKVDITEEDIILAMSDGVTDNLWEEEIADHAVGALQKWKENFSSSEQGGNNVAEAMKYVAQEIVLSARKIAEDPFAASPFMEKAVEEGLAIEGGKMDDISVVAAMCRRRKG